MSDADVKLDIGRELTRGLGAGSDPEVGREAAEEHREEIERGAQGRRHGLHHRRQGRRHRHRWRAGRRRDRQGHRRADDRRGRPDRSPSRDVAARCRPSPGIQKLKEKVDTQIVIPNDRLLTVSNDKTSMVNAFKMADEVLLQGVQGITDLITTPGLINTDFADVKMIMTNAGSALMGIGYATGEGRALNAARGAISSPLLEASIEGARGILLTIAGGSDLGLFEVNEAAEVIHGVAHPDANIIFGTVIDDEMGDEVRVTVIAAGFDRWDDGGTAEAPPAPPSSRRPTCSGPTRTTTTAAARGRRRVRRPVVPEVALPLRPLHPDRRRRVRRPAPVDSTLRPGRGCARSTATGGRRSTRPGEHAGAEADAAVTAVPGAVLAVVRPPTAPRVLLGRRSRWGRSMPVGGACWRGDRGGRRGACERSATTAIDRLARPVHPSPAATSSARLTCDVWRSGSAQEVRATDRVGHARRSTSPPGSVAAGRGRGRRRCIDSGAAPPAARSTARTEPGRRRPAGRLVWLEP